MKNKAKISKDKTENSNPKCLWFRAKHYGWGWYPATWQGWLTMCIWAALFILIVSRVEDQKEVAFNIVLPGILITAALIIVCYITGEKPSWRWGNCKY